MGELPAITDYKTIEQISLKILEASPDTNIVINKKGIVVIFNAQAEFMFDYDRSEVIGKNVSILISEIIADKHTKHIERFMTEPKTREMGAGQILQGKTREGTLFSVQIKLAPIIVPDAGLHVLAIVRRVQDIEQNLKK